MSHCKTATVCSGTSPQGTAYCLSAQLSQHRLTLIFIHGVGLNKQVWQPQIDAFSNEYQIITYDLLGHGDSPLPDEQASLLDYANQIVELLDHLGIKKFKIVGHSMGALVSLFFALHYPERVSTLVALNAVYERDAEQRNAVIARACKVLKKQAIDDVDVALQRWFANKTSPDDKKRIEQLAQWMRDADPIGVGRTYQLFALGDTALSGKLSDLKMPVLYLTGDKDINSTPLMSAQMADETPNGRVQIIAKEAHMMAYISPDKVNAAIRTFFNKHAGEV